MLKKIILANDKNKTIELKKDQKVYRIKEQNDKIITFETLIVKGVNIDFEQKMPFVLCKIISGKLKDLYTVLPLIEIFLSKFNINDVIKPKGLKTKYI